MKLAIWPGMRLISKKGVGFCFEEAKCKAYQEFVTVSQTSLGKVIRKHA
jgi:hypothetical protein